MAKKSFSVEKLIIQLSLGLLLAVGGIWGLQGGGDFGINSLKSVFSGSAENIAVIVFSIIELLAGIYLVLELFIGSLGKFKSIAHYYDCLDCCNCLERFYRRKFPQLYEMALEFCRTSGSFRLDSFLQELILGAARFCGSEYCGLRCPRCFAPAAPPSVFLALFL